MNNSNINESKSNKEHHNNQQHWQYVQLEQEQHLQ